MLVGADPFLAEFDRLAHQVFGTGEGAGMPVDVTRRGEELVAHFDIPGVASDAISLSLENHVLTVTAERHAAYGEGETVLVQERFDGAMTRRLRVPEWVDGERVAAEYADGVLTVVLPVAEQGQHPLALRRRAAGGTGRLQQAGAIAAAVQPRQHGARVRIDPGENDRAAGSAAELQGLRVAPEALDRGCQEWAHAGRVAPAPRAGVAPSTAPPPVHI